MDLDYEISIENVRPQTAKEALQQGKGQLGHLMPLDLIGAIGANALSGLLTLERDDILKEAYFLRGDPVFVASNDPQERLGQFLLLRGLLTPEQLEAALATMPHFGGRLAQALVGLKLLKPVDAINLLAEQVREKLLRTCCWDDGRFVWEQDKLNPHVSVALRLNSTNIVARAVRLLSEEQLRVWAKSRLSEKPRLNSASPYEAYEFGPALRSLLDTMDGSRSIGELLNSVSGASHRVVSAAVYALRANH
jgi:hypothetical protein